MFKLLIKLIILNVVKFLINCNIDFDDVFETPNIKLRING